MTHAKPNLYTFAGGLALKGHKTLSNQRPIAQLPIPPQLVIPIQEHIGQITEPVVKVGDEVYKGQLLARTTGKISSPIHASSSGEIIAIEHHPVPHPSGLQAQCIIIATDGKDQWLTPPRYQSDYLNKSTPQLLQKIADAGIVGMGGAGFPASVKLSPKQSIDTLILNGAECEPYITCDDLLMQTHAQDIMLGTEIIMQILGAKQCFIGIEDNKPKAIEAMQHALKPLGKNNIEVVVIPSYYPTGGEKQLIRVLTGQSIPSKAIPAEFGMLCHNVATAYAIYHAIAYQQPLISRIVTVTGSAIQQPQNIDVLIGTTIDDLVQACATDPANIPHLIMGGPMMGYSLKHIATPIIKTSNCVLALEQALSPPAMPCIRCGQCADVCPVQLLPQQLYWYAHAKDMDKIQNYALFDCIECGCCSYVCPSRIPLIQYFRYAKQEIWAQEKEQQKSDHARQRHQAREARLARQKAEREQARAKKKQALKKSADNQSDDPKKAAIAAALERVKQKKAKQTTSTDE